MHIYEKFSGIVAWYFSGSHPWYACMEFKHFDNLYHKQQIALVFKTEMLYWTANEESLWRVSSNILIIFLVNSKIALVFETETLNWTANEESLQRVSRFFIWSPRVFGSDFLFMRSFWHQCCNSTFYTQSQKCWDTPTKKRPFLLQITPGHRSVRYNTASKTKLHA